MPQKIIYARDAMYVSEAAPEQNYARIPIVYVSVLGYQPKGPAHCCGQGENMGLLQFEAFDLPDNHEILDARLCLFACCTCFGGNRVHIYPTAQPFDGGTVTWMTRPGLDPDPVSVLSVQRGDQNRYVECDILPLLQNQTGHCGAFGMALIADRKIPTAVMFYGEQSVYPAYVKIRYRKKENPPAPCPGCASVVENMFDEHVFSLEGTGGALFTPTVESARVQAITFFVKNTGSAPFEYHLQISPDGIDFIDDKQGFSLAPAEIKASVPFLFGKYVRLRLQPTLTGQQIKARIWLQMQTNNYMVKWPIPG